jgi:hypothetical protein
LGRRAAGRRPPAFGDEPTGGQETPGCFDLRQFVGGKAMTWNFDMASAPRGRQITVKRTVRGEEKETLEFVPDIIWIACKGGEVIRSYWISESKHSAARWAGAATGEEPLAWHEFFKPAHPNIPVQDAKAATTEPKATAESEPEQSVQIRRPEPHFILDDVGSGS